MTDLNSLLQLLGFNVHINDSSSPILLFACSILILNIISLLCFVNIIIYFTIIYITDHKIFIDKISQNTLLVKIINLYRKTRLSYLLFEIILLVVSLGTVIWLCGRVINGFIN